MYAYVPIFNAARYIILYDIYEFYAKSKTVHTFLFKNLYTSAFRIAWTMHNPLWV